MVNVYAPCGSSRREEDVQSCEAILQVALLRAAEIGQVPCFIAGDFNQDPLPSGGAAALALAGWRDLGLELGPTTRPGGGRSGRRIDRVYANTAAASLVRAVSLRWDTGIATHAAIEVLLEVGPKVPFLCRARPAPLHGPPAAGWQPEQALAAAQVAWERSRPEYGRALATEDVDQAWALLSGAALAFLRGRAATPTARRGGPSASFRRDRVAPEDAEGFASALALQRRAAAVRACSTAGRACQDEGMSAATTRWAAQVAVATLGCDGWAELLAGAFSGREAVAHAVATITEEYRGVQLQLRQARRDKWHAFVGEDIRKGGRRVFRWVRQPALQEPMPLITSPEGLSGGPAAELAAAGPAWHHLWGKADLQVPAECGLRDSVRALPDFPPVAPLTDEAVAAGVWALPLGRAAGPDDWTAEDLRLWPGFLLQALAALFRGVEACGPIRR